jgi:hypothetical protein
MIYLKAGGIYLLAMLVITAYFLFGTSKTAGAITGRALLANLADSAFWAVLPVAVYLIYRFAR